MPIFAFFVLFLLWATYEMKKSTRKQQERSDAFWNKEREANNVRKQDISKLNYIEIPVADLPFDPDATDRIKTYQDNILSLQGQKIVNLTGYTNTELKLQYGAANLPELMECDANFTKLASNVARLGQAFYDNGQVPAAKTMFEFGIRINTDVSNNYTTLAQIYYDENNFDAIYALMEQASGLNTLMKNSIVEQLRNFLSKDAPNDVS